MKNSILFILAMMASLLVHSQENNEYQQRKNIIKTDLTSHWIYRNAIILSYERVTTPNQTFCVTVGYQEFPLTSDLGSGIAVKENNVAYGLKFGGDYRFYLAKENKYLAPHGVYIGPYFMYHRFVNQRTLIVDNNGTPEEAISDSQMGILNIGFQLGYQFVIKNRWTIDLGLVGPAVANYKFTLTMSGDYTFDADDVENEIMRMLIDRFPLLEEAINEKEATSRGRLDTWSFGYRYQLQVGYHFGRKKK